MHKVHHHGHGLAVDFFFAGAVKVELQQLMRHAVDADFAARRHIDLDGVAIVDHFQWAFLVVGGHHGARFYKGATDVQRRLRFALDTGGELFAPALRTHFTVVTPVNSVLFWGFFIARFAVAVVFGMAIVLGVAVFASSLVVMAGFFSLVALGTLGQAIGHDGDFFARCCQPDLGGANGVLAVTEL